MQRDVRRCLAMITEERVLKTLRAVDITLKKLGCEQPRIAVGGVNPHASGDEEERLILPALEAARRDGMRVDGPIGADTLLQRAGYDAYVVMLHDQGHVAAKLLAPNRAAALTIGTPVLFSSVGHGAALDIAGQGRANPRAMVEAITRLAGRR
jgi:4-hydroxy-L-threonine phosphate dehydrogenase PdxA